MSDLLGRLGGDEPAQETSPSDPVDKVRVDRLLAQRLRPRVGGYGGHNLWGDLTSAPGCDRFAAPDCPGWSFKSEPGDVVFRVCSSAGHSPVNAY
jgi:hypothetical protein